MHDMKNTMMRFHLILLTVRNPWPWCSSSMIILSTVNYICAWLPPLCHQEQNTFFLWCVFAFFCKQLRSLTDLKCNSGIIIPFMQMFSLISASLISSFTHWWLCVNKHDYIVAFFYVPEFKRQRLNILNKIFLVWF